MKNIKLFKKYADLKKEAELLDEQIKETSRQIVEAMEEAGEKVVERPYGNFTIRERTNWKYNQDVKDMITSIQNTAQERGDATKTVTKFVTLTQPKKDEEKEN